MPIYNYFCNKCNDEFEINKPMSQASDSDVCPKCNTNDNHRLYGTNFSLKGTCWSKDGYKNHAKIRRDLNYRNFYREAKAQGKLPSQKRERESE